MASITNIREGLRANLAAITGLRCHATIPDQIATPAAVVGGPQDIRYDGTMQRGLDTYLIPIRVYAQRSDARAGQAALDVYLDSSGAHSVKQAIEADHTLGGAAMSVRVQSAKGYGSYEAAGVLYIGAEWLVEVIAGG